MKANDAKEVRKESENNRISIGGLGTRFLSAQFFSTPHPSKVREGSTSLPLPLFSCHATLKRFLSGGELGDISNNGFEGVLRNLATCNFFQLLAHTLIRIYLERPDSTNRVKDN